MLVHHGPKSYEEARSEAAQHARLKMEEKIASGKAKAEQLLQHLETNMPHDILTPMRKTRFIPVGNGVELEVPGSEQLRLHGNLLSQFADKTKADLKYLRKLLSGEFEEAKKGKRARDEMRDGKWRYDLAAHILNEHGRNMLPPDRNNLIRTVGNQARAFLSDNYNPYDGTALLASFVETSQKLDLPPVPVESTCTDLRASLKMFLPVVFEPIPGEVLCFGVEWFNSDFGCGRYGVRATLWRLWCTNFAMMEEGLFEVHLGPKLTNDRLIQFSRKTMNLNTQARIEATKDIVKGLLSPARVGSVMDAVRRADEEKVSWVGAKAALSKYLHIDEMEEAERLFNSEDDMRVPRKQSLYKVSQLLGLFAGQTQDGDRKLDLERASGAVLMPLLQTAA